MQSLLSQPGATLIATRSEARMLRRQTLTDAGAEILLLDADGKDGELAMR